MTPNKSILAALLLTLSLTVSGCMTTTPASTDTLSPVEVAMRQKQNENVRIIQGVATGVAIGAVVGGGLGLILSGGNKRSMLRGAGLGALAGGVLGGVDASKVNKETSAEASKQDELKTVIAQADKNIAHYRGMASMTAKLVEQEKAQITNLNTRYSAGQLDQATYRNQVVGARENVRIVNNQISGVERDIGDLEGAAQNGMNVSTQIAGLKKQKDSLTKQRDALVMAYSRVPTDIGVNVGS